MSTAGVPDGTSDDLISLRARYVHERVKRLRVDGNAQFREKAPAEVIASEEKRRDELKAELAKVLANLDALPKG